MKTSSLNTQHCFGFAAIRLQDASAIWSGIMATELVKYGPNTGLEDRMVEVRG